MSNKIVDAIHIPGLQNFGDYGRLNPCGSNY